MRPEQPSRSPTGGAAASPALGLLPGEIIVDHFAGGGGASTGVGLAAGRSPDVAINHNERAIAMHRANHPTCTHLISDIWEVDPVEACAGRPVGLLWTSPTCTHFSKAKGTRLSAKSIALRALAWVTCSWVRAVMPRIVCLENVEEFCKWGPLHRQHSEGCKGVSCVRDCTFGERRGGKRKGKVELHAPGCPGRACTTKCQVYQPVKSRQGETFRAFVRRLESYGYVVEWRILRACDYGAPTIRRRLFLVARRDGLPIVWPEPTHGPGRAHPYVPASECIDWADLGTSIFDRARPLKPNTLRRIAAGVRRFVLDRRPFLVPSGHGAKNDNDARVQSIKEPLRTICGHRGSHNVVSPVLGRVTFGQPVGGQAAIDKARELGIFQPGVHDVVGPSEAVASPYLVRVGNGERAGQAPRVSSVEEPLHTVMATRENFAATAAVLVKHDAAAAAMLIKHNAGHNDACGSAGQDLAEPLHTITRQDSKALAVAHLIRYNGDVAGAERAQGVEDPLTTIDTSNRHAVVASTLVKLRGTSAAHVASSGSSVEEPAPTLSAQGTHVAQVAAFLVKYFGKATEHSPGDPLGTQTTKDRYGLVTVEIDDVTYVIVDIRMRMLSPRELYLAQGFPREYQIDRDAEGRRFTRTDQVMMVGNSVPPQIAEAIARAQLWGRPEASAERVAA